MWLPLFAPYLPNDSYSVMTSSFQIITVPANRARGAVDLQDTKKHGLIDCLLSHGGLSDSIGRVILCW